MSVEEAKNSTVRQRNFGFEYGALEIEILYDGIAGSTRELITRRPAKPVSRKDGQLCAGSSHNFWVRHKSGFPIKSCDVVAQISRERIIQQIDLVQIAGASRFAIDLLQ